MITFDGHNFNRDIVGGYYHGWVNGVNWLLQNKCGKPTPLGVGWIALIYN